MNKFFTALLVLAIPTSSLIAQGSQQLVSSTSSAPYGNGSKGTTYTYSKKSRVVQPLLDLSYPFNGVCNNEMAYSVAHPAHRADTVITINGMDDTIKQYNTYSAEHKLIRSVEHHSSGSFHSLTIEYHTNGAVKKNIDSFYNANYTSETAESFHDDGRRETYTNYDNDNGNIKVYIKKYLYNATKQLTTIYNYYEPMVVPANTSYSMDSACYFYANTNTHNASEKHRYSTSYRSTGIDPYVLQDIRYSTFNAAGKLTRDSLVNQNSSSIDVDYFQYQGDSTIETGYYINNNNVRTESGKDIIVRNAANLLTDEYNYAHNATVPYRDYHFTYNAQNLMTSASHYQLDNNIRTLRDTIALIYNASNNVETIFNGDSSVFETFVYQAAQGEEDPVGLPNIAYLSAKVFPNPSTGGVFNIDVATTNTYDVVVYTMQGKLLGHYTNPKVIDLSFQPTGQYIVQVLDPATGASNTVSVIKN